MLRERRGSARRRCSRSTQEHAGAGRRRARLAAAGVRVGVGLWSLFKLERSPQLPRRPMVCREAPRRRRCPAPGSLSRGARQRTRSAGRFSRAGPAQSLVEGCPRRRQAGAPWWFSRLRGLRRTRRAGDDAGPGPPRAHRRRLHPRARPQPIVPGCDRHNPPRRGWRGTNTHQRHDDGQHRSRRRRAPRRCCFLASSNPGLPTA
jgi:hypothetical protein